MSKNEKPAFPSIAYADLETGGLKCDGLSKRELFAAMAMQGLSSMRIHPNEVEGLLTAYGVSSISEVCAKEAVARATALIEELERTK